MVKSASLILTKAAAAQRQLDAATRMFFAGEDPLAVHTVAAAAHRILIDLTKKQGRKATPDHSFHYGVFSLIRAFATDQAGALPEPLRTFGESSPAIAELSLTMRKMISDSGRVPTFDEFELEVPKGAWEKAASVANFLKHADRDSESLLDLKLVDNSRLLMNAMSVYAWLMHSLTPEMRVFSAYVCVLCDNPSGLDASQVSIFKKLKELDPSLYGAACLEALSVLKENGSE